MPTPRWLNKFNKMMAAEAKEAAGPRFLQEMAKKQQLAENNYRAFGTRISPSREEIMGLGTVADEKFSIGSLSGFKNEGFDIGLRARSPLRSPSHSNYTAFGTDTMPEADRFKGLGRAFQDRGPVRMSSTPLERRLDSLLETRNIRRAGGFSSFEDRIAHRRAVDAYEEKFFPKNTKLNSNAPNMTPKPASGASSDTARESATKEATKKRKKGRGILPTIAKAQYNAANAISKAALGASIPQMAIGAAAIGGIAYAGLGLLGINAGKVAAGAAGTAVGFYEGYEAARERSRSLMEFQNSAQGLTFGLNARRTA